MFTTLIGADELAAHLGRADWVVCDCRHDLADYESGRRAYAQGHVPGARFLHLDEDLAGPKTGTNGRHPLPHPMTFALRLGALGIDNGKQVVAYDASGGAYAARMWWMMRWLGHTRVAVLDGGWQAWVEGGHPISAEPVLPQPTTFTPRPRPEMAVDAGFIVGHLGEPTCTVLDARSPDRFRGENETLDPVAGHIPGALNRFFRSNLDTSGRFKPAEALRAEFADVLRERDAGAVVHQCGSGVTACHNLLAMEHAGLAGSRLYPGSWSEWVSDRVRPMER
ncbi:MAG TPA: sulfurtransferase [Burkholderiales bacterium]|nr:sulfurtransferase [Burkholderiales bacterium]